MPKKEDRMKYKRIGIALIVVFAIAACQSQSALVTQNEDKLAAAGFVVRPANTPERIAMLKRLPPHQFVQRANGNVVHYVYADPLVCGCLYVGTQQAYNQYKLHQLQQHLADEQLMTAQTYSDTTWNWQGWGPWGSPGFGFVYGPAGW
jgi:hypothetical protein